MVLLDRLIRPSASAWRVLIAAFVFFALFLWLFPLLGIEPERTGYQLIAALGTALVGLAALFLGQTLRARQEEAARARAELALNVELSTRVVASGSDRLLEVEVRVKNISSNTWNVPVAYVFVVGFHRSYTGTQPSAVTLPEPPKLAGLNIARFANSMTQLCPDEEEVFTRAFDLGPRPPAFATVLVEVVGAPSSSQFDALKQDEFLRFMEHRTSDSSTRGAGAHGPDSDEVPCRHRYSVFESAEPALKVQYGKRVLVLPPHLRTGPTQADRLDELNTLFFAGMLEGTMMWSRQRLVSLAEPTEVSRTA